MKTKIIVAVVLASVLFHSSAFAQPDMRPPGLYAVVGEQSTPLKYTRGTTEVTSSLGLSADYSYRTYRYEGVASGVEASDTFVLVVNPKQKRTNRMLTADDIFHKSNNPDQMRIIPLSVNQEESRREFDRGITASGMDMNDTPNMEFTWDYLSDNSFLIKVGGLTPGEYGIVFRISLIYPFYYSSIFDFTVPETYKEDGQ